MKSYFVIPASVLFIFLFSCNNGTGKSTRSDNLDMTPTASQEPASTKKEQPIPVGNENIQVADSAATPLVNKKNNWDWDKKIIKTATLTLEVKDFKQYNDNVHKSIRQFGAYIAQEEQNQAEDKLETVISIKVPVDQFDDMMSLLPANDAKVMVKKISTEDVTGQVVDTKSRLEAKKQVRLKYLEFLKGTKNMEEVVQVQNEINAIQEEIESASGRIGYLSHEASFSTINLTLYQPLTGFIPAEKPSFFDRVKLSFSSGAEWVADIFIGLLAIWPLLIIAIIGVFLLKRFVFVKAIRHNS